MSVIPSGVRRTPVPADINPASDLSSRAKRGICCSLPSLVIPRAVDEPALNQSRESNGSLFTSNGHPFVSVILSAGGLAAEVEGPLFSRG